MITKKGVFPSCFTYENGVWRGAESNRRHVDFQSTALPTELASRKSRVNLSSNAGWSLKQKTLNPPSPGRAPTVAVCHSEHSRGIRSFARLEMTVRIFAATPPRSLTDADNGSVKS